MDVFVKVPRYDVLGLYRTSLQIRQIMEPDERVFYSCKIEKFNRYGFCQDRVLLITNKYIYTMSQGQFNFNINRKASVLNIDGITASKDIKCDELIIHSKEDYDCRYRCGPSKINIKRVLSNILKASNVDVKVFEVPEKKLSNYVTSKKDHQKGKYKRPAPAHIVNYLVSDQFQFTLIPGQTEGPQYYKECVADFNTMVSTNKEYFEAIASQVEAIKEENPEPE